MASDAQWLIKILATDETAAAFRSLQDRMKQAQGVMDGVTKSIDAIKTAAAGFAGMEAVKWFRETAKSAADVEELGKKLGFTSDQVQAMQRSAEATGQTFEQQSEYFKNNRKELDELTERMKAQGQLMSGPLRSAFADVNEQLELFNRTIGVTRAQFQGGTIDKGVGMIASMIRDMGQSLAYFEVYKGTITSVRELLALLTGAGGAVGVTAENRAAQQIDKLRAASLQATIDFQKAQSRLKMLESQPEPNNRLVKIAKLSVEETRIASEQAKKQVADAEDALERGKKILETAAEPPAIKVPPPPVPPPAYSMGSNAGEESAAKKLGILIAERMALERAMQSFQTAFNIRETDTVEQVEKRLQRAVELDKQIATITKNVPKDSEVAKQLTAEAELLSELNAKWEEYKRIVAGAEQTIARYGNGSKELEKTLKDLAAQKREGKISEEELAWATKDATDKAKQQELAYRGVAGGLNGFTAGIESVLRPASQMSREFQYGQKAMQLLDDAITQMVNNGEVNFQRLLASFLVTIAQMEARAAVSSLWKLAVGDSGAGGAVSGGLISGLISGASALFGSAFSGSSAMGSLTYGSQANAPMSPNFGGPKAAGGPVSPSSAYLVGEVGPEIFVPHSAGSIIPNDQLGGGDTVQVNMSNSFGGGVTHAEMLRYGAMIEERAKAGAMAGIEAKRKRGGSIKQVFRG